ncbi:MAG TPA: hypothetical protein VLA58_01375 [Chitinophagaceae bacterium]|nr:hypothetical protein [Chitinophagaceae bacterium]
MVMKRIPLILFTVVLAAAGYCQSPSGQDLAIIRSKEDSLKEIAPKIIMGREAAERFRSDSLFTRIFVRALRQKHSFHYPFDSIVNISKLYAPDSSFRIFTWQVVKDESMARRHGAIQMNTPDGSLKLFPLIDKTNVIGSPIDTITSNDSWIGAIYYKIIQKDHNGKPYYTLLGYDENTMRSTMKRIEVMHFDGGKPVFGGPFFSFREDSLKKPDQARYWIEYKKGGNASLQFDEEMDLIIYDHLIPENGEAEKKYTYIPDGDYEGFKWKDGKWVHINKVFNFMLKDGEAPAPVPLTEDKFGPRPPVTPTPAPVKKKKQ